MELIVANYIHLKELKRSGYNIEDIKEAWLLLKIDKEGLYSVHIELNKGYGKYDFIDLGTFKNYKEALDFYNDILLEKGKITPSYNIEWLNIIKYIFYGLIGGASLLLIFYMVLLFIILWN